MSSVNRRIEDPSYASSIKKGGHRESFRAFDERRDSEQQPYASKLGRELSERMESERRREYQTASKVPQSARDGERVDRKHSSLRDFSRSRSPSHGRRQGSASNRSSHSPAFLSS